MNITYKVNEKMNHHEIKLEVHPKNKKIAQLLVEQFKEKLGDIEAFDEYHNAYPIPLLGVYYFEIVDQRIFAYTEKDVYRLSSTTFGQLKEKMKHFGFYQINVRTLVNVKHVQKYHVQRGARRRIVLDNGDILISSRHFKKEFDKMVDGIQYLEIIDKK